MEYSFWAFFALGALLTAIIILWRDKDALKDTEELKVLLVLPIMGGLFVGVIVFFLTTNVVIIKDNYKYEDNYYLFKYVNNKNHKHSLSLFESYIDNQSSQEVVIYEVHYSRAPNNYYGYTKPSYDSYAPHKMSTLKNSPDYIFQAPPKSIRLKQTESGWKYALTYKDSYDVIFNDE